MIYHEYREELLWILARITVMPFSSQPYDVFYEDDGERVAIMTTSVERKQINQPPVEICRLCQTNK